MGVKTIQRSTERAFVSTYVQMCMSVSVSMQTVYLFERLSHAVNPTLHLPHEQAEQVEQIKLSNQRQAG